MTQDTWAYVTCNAGRVEYSIFDARDMRVAHGGVALSDFGPHEPNDVLRSLDVSFVVLDGAFAGPRVTCPASLAAPHRPLDPPPRPRRLGLPRGPVRRPVLPLGGAGSASLTLRPIPPTGTLPLLEPELPRRASVDGRGPEVGWGTLTRTETPMFNEVTWYRADPYGYGIESATGIPSKTGRSLNRYTYPRTVRKGDGWRETPEEAWRDQIRVARLEVERRKAATAHVNDRLHRIIKLARAAGVEVDGE